MAGMMIYLADALESLDDGAVLAVSVNQGSARVESVLKVKHNPDVAISRDGSTLFVVHTYLDGFNEGPPGDELLTIDTATFSVRNRVRFRWRSLYNVAPTGPAMVPSWDGRYLYVNKTETLGDDAALNTIGVYDIAAGAFLDVELRLPYQLINYGPIPGSSGVFFLLSGRLGDGLGFLDGPAGSEPDWVYRYPSNDPMHRALAGSAAHLNEPAVDIVTKTGLLQRWWPLRREITPAQPIGLPPNVAIPLQHVIATPSGRLLVGLSDRENASRGGSAALMEFEQVDGHWRPLRVLRLKHLAEKVALTKDEKRLVTLVREDCSLIIHDAESGELTQSVMGLGDNPVAMTGPDLI
jgi:hypothetical protein